MFLCIIIGIDSTLCAYCDVCFQDKCYQYDRLIKMFFATYKIRVFF